MTDKASPIDEAADAAEAASNTKALDVVARSGFAVMALLHIVVGAIAIALALGARARPRPPGQSSSWPPIRGDPPSCGRA